MSNAISRRLARRFTAMGAGAALLAAGLSLGVMAPANAASTVTGGVTDGFGNPMAGYLDAYLQDPVSGEFSYEDSLSVSNDGYIEGTLNDGVYKLEFNTYGSYSEYYKDAADQATAAPVNVAGGVPVALGAWTIDQPYVLGTVTNTAGKPLPGATVRVFDAATGNSLGGTNADEKGAFKVPTQSAPVKVSISAGSDYALEYYADAGDLASAYPFSATAAGTNLGNHHACSRREHQRPGVERRWCSARVRPGRDRQQQVRLHRQGRFLLDQERPDRTTARRVQ